MTEDWRLTVTPLEGQGHRLAASLEQLKLESEARARLGGRVALSSTPDQLFLYAETREAAEQAQTLVSEFLETDALTARFALERWHPIEEEWEPASLRLPASQEEIAEERGRLEAKEAADSLASGYAEWEIRLDLPSHRDAVELAQRLESEGLGVTRRWRYLLVGATSRDEAHALAERLAAEAPSGARMQVQAGGEMAWEVAPGRPFPLFVLPS